VVSETLKGIRRTIGTAQKGKLPLLTADLQKLLAHVPDTLGGVRDRALLLVGFAGALRRSELAALDVEQVEFNSDGLVVLLDLSKTDPEGKGETVAIPFGSHHATCPVRALKKWLEDARVQSGPLFRAVDRHGRVSDEGLHANSIGAIVKRACRTAGYNAKEFAGHSLRAGLATQAATNGVSARQHGDVERHIPPHRHRTRFHDRSTTCG
jgi:integrase